MPIIPLWDELDVYVVTLEAIESVRLTEVRNMSTPPTTIRLASKCPLRVAFRKSKRHKEGARNLDSARAPRSGHLRGYSG